MDRERIKSSMSDGKPTSPMLRLMLAPFDALTEINLKEKRIRAILAARGKYFAPVNDGSITDMFRYTIENMVHPEDREVFIAANDMSTLQQRLENPDSPGETRARYRYKLLDGGWRWTERVCVGGKRFGLPPGVAYSFVFDIEEQMSPQTGTITDDGSGATHNELTGLVRSEIFFSRGKTLAQKHPEGWCFVAFDIELFKLFNEWYGRQQGDFLLARIGAELRKLEEETGSLAGYFGQDDFAVLMPFDMERIERLYNAIHALVMEYGTSVGFMPAFGICPLNAETTLEDICDRAAMAARHAKQSYHSRVRVFEPSMYEKTDRDYHILSDFQRALKENELYVQLQPQCEIDSGKIVGAESLVRWRKANGETVSPAVFVPVLEQYGFVTDLDKYVWEEVCAWQRRWIDGGHTPLPVSLNVSQIDIFSIDVPEHLAGLLEKYALPVDVIKIEIAESAYAENAGVADAVRRLRDKGFTVLMDDFGSGYSSLNMLRSLMVDIIKLDARFLRMSGDDGKGVRIMESIVNMAKTMSVPIIVEGVESREEADFLAGLGCRYVQGYFFYRPMSFDEFEALIAEPGRIDTDGFQFKANEQFRVHEFLDQNVFSDAMLNNLLGPVAFFSWHGDELDIVRFNQQFRDEVKIPQFRQYLTSAQRLVSEEERPKLFELFERALAEPLKGAQGELHIYRPDSVPAQISIRLFYLEEDESGKKFYASVHDITQMTRLNNHLRLLSRLSSDTVVFLFHRGGVWSAQVATHGLEPVLGLDRAALERELNDRAFHRRIPEEEREELHKYILKYREKAENYSRPFTVTAANGERVSLRVRFGPVRDKTDGAEYIMVLRGG